MKNTPTQTEIAAELGISKAALSKLKKQGMPVHSADAARNWRSRNLHPGRIRNDPGPSPRTLIERAEALIPLGLEALRAGRFELVADELRRALRAVPFAHRDELRFAVDLFDALIGPAALRELCPPQHGGIAPVEPAEGGADPVTFDIGGVFYNPGEIMYALACGELRMLPGAP